MRQEAAVPADLNEASAVSNTPLQASLLHSIHDIDVIGLLANLDSAGDWVCHGLRDSVHSEGWGA